MKFHLTLIMAVLIAGCQTNDTTKNDGLSSSSGCWGTLNGSGEFKLGNPLSCKDVSIREVEPIASDRVLILGAGFAFSAGRGLALAELDPDGVKESPINSLLLQYGEPITISNVVDGNAVILLGESTDQLRIESLKAFLVNLSESKIVSKVDLPAQTGDAPWFSVWRYGQHQFKVALFAGNKAVVSGIGLERLHLSINFAEKTVTTRTIIKANESILMESPLLAIDQRSEASDIIFSFTSLTHDEYLALQSETHEMDAAWPGSYHVPVVYASRLDGSIISSFILPFPDLAETALAVSGGRVAAIATSSDAKNTKKPLVTMLRFDDVSKTFELIWQKSISISDNSDSVHTALFWGGHGLLIGGDAGYTQVKTGSVVAPGDAFIALMDIGGGEVLGSELIAQTRKHDAVVAMHMMQNRPFLWTYENAPITHEIKSEPSFSVLYDVKASLSIRQ